MSDAEKELLEVRSRLAVRKERRQKRMKRRVKDVTMFLPDAESMTLRQTGERVDVTIQMRRGELSFVLLPREGRSVRVINLRPRDKKRKPGQPIAISTFTPWSDEKEDS